jgi:hypothetical protein
MKRNAAEELAALYGMSLAANEEFTELGNVPATLVRHESGWDPYEVWQSRLKAPRIVIQERDRGDCTPHSVPSA